MSEKELRNIPGLKEDDVFVIKKFSFKERLKLKQKSMRISLDPVSGKQDGFIDLAELQKWTVIYGIKKCPLFAEDATEDVKEKALLKDSFPASAGEYLFQQINEFNNFADIKNLQKK